MRHSCNYKVTLKNWLLFDVVCSKIHFYPAKNAEQVNKSCSNYSAFLFWAAGYLPRRYIAINFHSFEKGV
ncbi:MAG: hypothetical protein AUK34_10240 [Ignavibacteria bacterium CG2_30_36_16]|nr:MAG: hypothetical protein AUK34_10240 [Ignavibacteria bacterium CG2_30_36_16]PJB00712.1 MAG: hypothetical protein CO127_07540 [Ignavibacteria bacterium CG_4_9_14_3_um_filter_36_18]